MPAVPHVPRIFNLFKIIFGAYHNIKEVTNQWMGQTIPHHGPSQNGTVKLSTTKPTSEFTSGHVGVAVSLQRFSLRENHHHQDTELIETLNREVCGSSLLSYWCSSAMKTVDEFILQAVQGNELPWRGSGGGRSFQRLSKDSQVKSW